MLLYAVTIFLSAFLLFQVQPLIAKIILPWFGGSAAVWSAAMMFFQLSLLAGYAYAHFLGRAKAKTQMMVHGTLLLISCLLLPIYPSATWKPSEAGDPTLRILLLLAATIGLPYFLLSSTSPLLQVWYVRRTGNQVPYRLFALSNFGSMLALLSFPFVIEPTLASRMQAYTWSGLFVLFAALCAYAAWKSQTSITPGSSLVVESGAVPIQTQQTYEDDYRAASQIPGLTSVLDPKRLYREVTKLVHPDRASSSADQERRNLSMAQANRAYEIGDTKELQRIRDEYREDGDAVEAEGTGAELIHSRHTKPSGKQEISTIVTVTDLPEEPAPPTMGDMTIWVALAACASALLVSVTNHMSANVAPIPLLWVVPLALYLLSFILSFESDRIYQRWLFVPWVAPALGWMAYSIYASEGNYHIKYAIPIFSLGLFLCCMMCHGELAMRKPAAKYLTSFYLMISVGGAIGGIFVALIAPHLFKTFLELPIALTATGILAVIAMWDIEFKIWKWDGAWLLRFALAIGVGLLGGYLARMEIQDREGYHLMVRNFYGALRVRDDSPGTEFAIRNLLHGTINHGSQRLNEVDKYKVGSYYGLNSGIGRTMQEMQARGPVRYGVVGLGAGVMSGYAREGDYVRIYEINPIVPVISTLPTSEFSFYTHAPADKAILMGDARLTMEKQLQDNQPPNYDVLVIDAFSSDAIPVHLLTRESFELYGKLLKPNGVLAVHISNRYLDLAPVCQRGAEALGWTARVVYDEGDSYSNSTTWVLITADPSFFESPQFAGVNMYPPTTNPKFRTWTDDYSNIVSILSLN